jgi:hypothetical protein
MWAGQSIGKIGCHPLKKIMLCTSAERHTLIHFCDTALVNDTLLCVVSGITTADWKTPKPDTDSSTLPAFSVGNKGNY